MAENMNKTTKESICHEWSKGNDDSINMDQWIQCKSSSYRRTPKEIHRKKVINGEKLTARSSN